MDQNIIKRTTLEELYDRQNQKELPLALKLIETAQNEGVTVKEFFSSLDRAKHIVARVQAESLVRSIQSDFKTNL